MKYRIARGPGFFMRRKGQCLNFGGIFFGAIKTMVEKKPEFERASGHVNSEICDVVPHSNLLWSIFTVKFTVGHQITSFRTRSMGPRRRDTRRSTSQKSIIDQKQLILNRYADAETVWLGDKNMWDGKS